VKQTKVFLTRVPFDILFLPLVLNLKLFRTIIVLVIYQENASTIFLSLMRLKIVCEAKCDKLIADKKKSSSSLLLGVGQLRHLTEKLIEDGHSNDNPDGSDVLLDSTLSNDTNEKDLIYFICMTNHYLRLVWSTNPGISCHSMKYPIIADSGANFHMIQDHEFITAMSPATGYVLLGDGKTKLQIQGIGTISCKIGQHTLTVDNVDYIPDLAKSVYRLFLHIRCSTHSLFS
jgi:hypothetical protein